MVPFPVPMEKGFAPKQQKSRLHRFGTKDCKERK